MLGFGSDDGDSGNDSETNANRESYTKYVVHDGLGGYPKERSVCGRFDTLEEAEEVASEKSRRFIETKEVLMDEPLQDNGMSDGEVEAELGVYDVNEDDVGSAEANPGFYAEDEADDGPEVIDLDAEDSGNNEYRFFGANGTSETRSTDTHRWTLGNHGVDNDVDPDALKDAAAEINGVDPGLSAALEEAAGKVESANVDGFECPVCGLNHGHGDGKHDIRDTADPGFGVSDEFAEFMQYTPYCHCGVNELAMLLDFYGHIEMSVFEEDRFSRLNDLRNSSLIDICRLMREESGGIGSMSVDQAVQELGLVIPNDYDAEIRDFYEVWKAVKQAADGAPISGSTRNEIDNIRTNLNEDFNYDG